MTNSTIGPLFQIKWTRNSIFFHQFNFLGFVPELDLGTVSIFHWSKLGFPALQETALRHHAGPPAFEGDSGARKSPLLQFAETVRHRTQKFLNKSSNQIAIVPNCFPGLDFKELDTSYWKLRKVSHHGSDVVLRSAGNDQCFFFKFVANLLQPCCNFMCHRRTKRWLSDQNFQPKKFWYLPACVANLVAQEPPPPGSHCFDVTCC